MDPSSTQENQANIATNAPTQEQVEDPPYSDQVTMQEPRSPIINANQDQPSTSQVEDSQGEATQVDQGQHSGQDGDTRNQVIPPRNNGEIKACRVARMARAYKKIDVSLDKVADNLTSRRVTRGQLSRFSEHHAHISMV